MTISLTDENGAVGTTAMKVDAFTIEASVPELRSLASFFTKCAEEVARQSVAERMHLMEETPDYEMMVPEIFVGA